jgi:7-cyano-7-deazaguanine synthase
MTNDRQLTLATVLLSGGIDSAACAHFLAKQGNRVHGVLVDFGQAAAQAEREAAQSLANLMHITLTTYQVHGAPLYQTGELIGRNAFLISAALFLTRKRQGLLAIGIHAGTTYFDCSPTFLDAMAKLVAEQTDGRVNVVAPFLHWDKSDVYQYFISAGLPIQLTYSCEAGTRPPCGKCISCRDRRALGC